MAKCKVGQILAANETSQDEQVALLHALHNKEVWPAKALANAINKTRFSVGATTVKEHRRQTCGCFQ